MATVTVYYGEFAYHEQMDRDVAQMHTDEGAISVARMPTPTRRHPEKTKLVLLWVGERTQKIRDTSSQMGPHVTELAAMGSLRHRLMAASYRTAACVWA